MLLSTVQDPGVAKSIVRVVRVVHLLLRTSNLFQLTCPWTSEKKTDLRMSNIKEHHFISKNRS